MNTAERIRRHARITMKNYGELPSPPFLVLFINSVCNMKCDHCMFWERIDNPGEEMALSDMETVARSIPPLRTLSLTGGEPFLRSDLSKILDLFYRENQTHHEAPRHRE